MPKYMLMLFDNPSADAALSPDQMQGIVREYSAWAKSMAQAGKFVGGEKLAEEGGRVMRPGGGTLVITDGPYAESREVLGGYFVINAASYDDAVEIARTCPHMKYGAAIHVRRVDEI